MSRPNFPLAVKCGSAVAMIYYTPARQKGRKYDAFTLSYTFAQVRRRKKFHDLSEARTAAEAAVNMIANGAMEKRHLSEHETSEYLACRERLSTLGIGVADAVREFADAKNHLRDVHLLQAVQFYRRYGGDKLRPTTVPDAIARLLQEKKDQRVADRYLYDLTNRLKKFGAAFKGQIAAVTADEINAWLKALGCEPRTQNNYRAAIVQLFNFARDKLKALPHWVPHEAQQTIQVQEVAKDNEIYAPAEMRQILEKAPAHIRPLLAIRAFSGIRNEELWKIDWRDFDFEQHVIKLKSAVTKVGSRRVMPLLPNLATWLSEVNRAGRVADGYASAKTMSAALSNAVAAAGVVPRRNALRNSYTSYRLAVLKEVGKVAEETGNSPAVIKREYLELASPNAGAEWFNIKLAV